MKIGAALLATAVLACGSEARRFDHSHALWDGVLGEHVEWAGRTTTFDYRSLKAGRGRFERYLNQLGSVEPKEYGSWTRNQQLAFLINAYNAFTVEWVLRHYPIQSIRETAGNPWAKEFVGLLGEKRSLDEIEHEMIRSRFAEPLVHFALNCAAIGCPPLQDDAFAASRLKRQLESAARNFMRDEKNNRLENGALALSSIFDWYGEDFRKRHGGVRAFAAQYMTEDPRIAEKIRGGPLEIRYIDYDWGLNGPSSAREAR